MKQKSNTLLRNKRIAELVSQGKRRAEICQLISEEEGVSPRTVERNFDNYVKSISESFADNKDEYAVMALEWVVLSAQIAQQKDSAKDLQNAAKELRQLVGIGEKVDVGRQLPEIITITEKDFSGLKVIDDNKASNDE